jgi:hypothetical protein
MGRQYFSSTPITAAQEKVTASGYDGTGSDHR